MVLRVLGLIVALLLGAIGFLHIYWAVGGRWASEVVIPESKQLPAFLPSRATTLAVALALMIASWIVVGQLGFVNTGLPSWLFEWGTRVLAAVFFLRAVGEFRLVGFFKRVHNTRFAQWDTFLFSPLCLFMALVLMLLAK
jgi:hypothetical protein